MLWRCKDKEFNLEMPIYMGILNVTPDSFSDGGNYNSLDKAIEHAHELCDQGAHIIDVGGESTRPGSAEVSAQVELKRVLPVVKTLVAQGICVSVDTRHALVASACIESGAQIINDISGFESAQMREAVAKNSVGCVLMHMQGKPKTMQAQPKYKDVFEDVKSYMLAQAALLENMGVSKSRICLDFGIGFGKTLQHNKELLVHTSDFASLGYPLMLAVSRKSYIGNVCGTECAAARDNASALCAAAAFRDGARILRVHNVEATAAAIKSAKRVLISLGSNKGDRLKNITSALDDIAKIDDLWLWRTSSIYESEPAYKQDQRAFANAMALCYTTLAPQELLHKLQNIENTHGRIRLEKNGPRTLDLDIVDYEGIVCESSNLTLPHPRALERDFVISPLQELVPNFQFSNNLSIKNAGAKYGHVTSILKKCI